ncbi:RluA family pseudouridine synthase [Tepidiforma sp.]|uniref:RluA family pseudouridine synthase n=1 Tax=Tepidiforma sp. TaxID=2682230 RepID=UPI002ADD7FD9|nr:RluA family pseudouridine synthase [Tepidiforma sp.]
MDHAGSAGAGAGRHLLNAEAPGRLDACIAAAVPGLSRARVQRLIEGGHVLLNGEVARKSARVEAGDRIELTLPETGHDAAEPGFDLPVLYEDDALAVIDKPAGLAVHGAPGDTAPSVAGWWLARLGPAATAFDAEHPGIVHRLDKETSGVLLLAKTPAAQAALSRAFELRRVHKCYLAMVEGQPRPPHAVVEAPIHRDPRDRTRMAVTARGRPSRTEYRVVAGDGGRSLLEVFPETGRTHQIRVHLASIGHPVVGDPVYGRAGEGRRHLLHAWRLELPHPTGGTLRASAPPPADLLEAIRAIAGEAVASRYAAPPAVTCERGQPS